MMTVEFITALFYEVDEQIGALPKHPEAHLWPSEVVTLGLLHALKGVGNRPFYRWLTRDYPHIPHPFFWVYEGFRRMPSRYMWHGPIEPYQSLSLCSCLTSSCWCGAS
jgi:hypothetical protein